MSHQNPPSTTCKTCGRIVFVSDVDRDGNCSDHGAPSAPRGPRVGPMPEPSDVVE